MNNKLKLQNYVVLFRQKVYRAFAIELEVMFYPVFLF